MTPRRITFALLLVLLACMVAGAQRVLIDRRSVAAGGGFTPLDISPHVWLSADTITGLSDGDDVTTWEDQSGNGEDFVQDNAADRPQYKTGVLNSLPSVFFGNGVDYLTNVFSSYPSQPNTYWFVLFTTNVLSQQRIADSSAGQQIVEATHSAQQFRIYAGSFLSPFLIVGTNWFILETHFNGSTSEIYTNGVFYAKGDAGTQNIAGNLFLGCRDNASEGFLGYLSEIVIAESVSTNNRVNMRNYLNDKYAIY